MCRGFVVLILFARVLTSSVAMAQPTLGTFRWQLEPYCNVISVAVTPTGGVYRLEGTDDQCGAGGDLASAIGTAFLNPDGTVGIGLNVVSTPGGAPVHIDASISVSSLSGTWSDSAGNSGSLVFRTGAGSGGTPRQATQTIGAVAVNPTQVQLRIGGTCPSGSFMTGVGQTGTVICGGGGGGGVSLVIAGFGLIGGGTGAVTLELPRTVTGAHRFSNSEGFVANGVLGAGNIPVEGPGTRAMWYPGKAAFRAGFIVGTQWDTANVGNQSVAFGSNTTASGTHSTATGDSTIASGAQSVALGRFTTASSAQAFAMGDNSAATGKNSTAMGLRVTASGDNSIVLGTDATALPAAKGAIILSDRSSLNTFTGFAPNQFLVRSAGGAGIYTNSMATTGVELAPGGSAWLNLSDVNMKENFRDLEDGEVLTKIARMPIREWNYKAQDAAIRHVGPTAQDFRAAFGLGENPLRISTIDADGIALRAIQALEARTRELMRENAELRARLEVLEGKQP